MKRSDKILFFIITLSIGMVAGAAIKGRQEPNRKPDIAGDRYDSYGASGFTVTSWKDGKQVGRAANMSNAIIRTPDVDSFIINLNQ